MPKTKPKARSRGKPTVFAVPKSEASDVRYHEVLWAKDGNLNASFRRGHMRRFRDWSKAKVFARQKAKQIGCTATIHPY